MAMVGNFWSKKNVEVNHNDYECQQSSVLVTSAINMRRKALAMDVSIPIKSNSISLFDILLIFTLRFYDEKITGSFSSFKRR